MTNFNSDLAIAFPAAVRADALDVLATLPKQPLTSRCFSVLIRDELVEIPYRVYQDPSMIDSTLFTDLQIELLDCLMTRHHNGFVREAHLMKILGSKNEWIPAFVIQLTGEYVVEILCAIRDNLQNLDINLYRAFLERNLEFFNLTKQRVASYWACYYSGVRKEDYVGYQIVRFFDSLIASNH